MARFGRRKVLRGLGAGAALLSPIVGGLVREASGQPSATRRVIFVTAGNGMDFRFAHPANVDPTTFGEADLVNVEGLELDASHTYNGHTIGPMMAALGRYSDRMAVVQGLSNVPNAGGPHGHGFAALTAVPNEGAHDEGGPGGVSIDQHLAQRMPQGSLLTTLVAGTSKSEGIRRRADISALGRGRPVTTRTHPADVASALFGTVSADDPLEPMRRERVLDFLAEDLRRIDSRLAAEERAKLERYLEATEATHDRLRRIADGVSEGCQPAEPFDGISLEARTEAVFELASLALTCGLTNVVTLSLCTNSSSLPAIYKGLGYSLTLHYLGHGFADPVMGPSTNPIHDFHASLIAGLCDRLASVPEDDGTMLENTVIVWMNENGGRHHSRSERWPVVLIGDAGGALRANGRYLRYPLYGQPGHRTLADFYCTLCQALGVPRDDFGAGSVSEVAGPLEELLAG